MGRSTIFGSGSSLIGLILGLTIWPYLHIPITHIPDKLLKGMFLFCWLKLFLWAFFVMLDCIRGLLCLGGRNCIDYPRTSKDSKVYQITSGDFFEFFFRKNRRFPRVTREIPKIFNDYGRSPNISDSLPKIAEDHPMTATLSLLFMVFTSNDLFSCIFRICKFWKQAWY